MARTTRVSRADVLRYRVHVQQLARTGTHDDAAILDLGVQDTGPDGYAWALALRGVEVPPADLVLAWTLRGAPHAYRRAEAAQHAVHEEVRDLEQRGHGAALWKERHHLEAALVAQGPHAL